MIANFRSGRPEIRARTEEFRNAPFNEAAPKSGFAFDASINKVRFCICAFFKAHVKYPSGIG